MTSRWEYKIVTSDDISGGLLKKNRAEIEACLNRLGAEGWEIINMDFRELDVKFSFTGLGKRPSR